ncbi:MAG: polymerase sigma factor, sigma-70 family [Bacteroidetes bacterium]|nr:polymerase sigma factor, sigma-70 family [Bacteroidota bacterium]
MLSDMEQAKDASQDILLKIYNEIATLHDASKFMSWSLKIAKNHLLNEIKRNNRFQHISFDIMEQDCNIRLPEIETDQLPDPEKDILLAELKISCSQAMLMCLSHEERLIYIFSSMFGLNSTDGSSILEIAPEAYRQKLHRAKSKLKNFLENNCGLINKAATCKCRKRLNHALSNGRISRKKQDFTSERYLPNAMNVSAFIKVMESYEDYSDTFKHTPYYIIPEEEKVILLEKVGNYF